MRLLKTTKETFGWEEQLAGCYVRIKNEKGAFVFFFKKNVVAYYFFNNEEKEISEIRFEKNGGYKTKETKLLTEEHCKVASMMSKIKNWRF